MYVLNRSVHQSLTSAACSAPQQAAISGCTSVGWLFQGLLESQDGVNDDVVSRSCVQHRVIERSVWPLHVEITLDKSSPVAVDGVHQPCHLFLAHAIGYQTAHSFLFRGIEKD